MKSGYADTPEGQIHYVTEGQGEPLLLLHASPRSSRLYWRLMPLLVKEYRVVALDTLGFGNSDPLPPKVTMEALAQADVHFMDALGIQRAHVFGIHTGNKIAVAMAAEFQERVESVMLCGQPHSIIDDKAKRNAAILALVGGHMSKPDPTPDGSHLVSDWASEFSRVSNTWWDPKILSQKTHTPDQFQGLENRILDSMQSRPSIFDIYNANFAYDWGAGLRKIKARTLFVELATGHELELHGRQGENLTRIVPNSKLASLEGADGNAIESQPEEIAGAVLGFLQGARQEKAAAPAS